MCFFLAILLVVNVLPFHNPIVMSRCLKLDGVLFSAVYSIFVIVWYMLT